MATSGTYAFNPSAGDVVLQAFAAIQLGRRALTSEHLTNAGYWANMVGVNWSNRQPNMWQSEALDFNLSAGVPSYNLQSRTAVVSLVTVGLNGIDRPLSPMSMTDYGSIANKAQPGSPTSYMLDLATPVPTITLWPVPVALPALTMRVETFRQMQDIVLPGGVTVDSPYRFLEAFTLALAARLAMLYKPEAAQALQLAAEDSWRLAAAQDQERVAIDFQPVMSGYFPR